MQREERSSEETCCVSLQLYRYLHNNDWQIDESISEMSVKKVEQWQSKKDDPTMITIKTIEKYNNWTTYDSYYEVKTFGQDNQQIK